MILISATLLVKIFNSATENFSKFLTSFLRVGGPTNSKSPSGSKRERGIFFVSGHSHWNISAVQPEKGNSKVKVTVY